MHDSPGRQWQRLHWLWLSLLIIVADQWTKVWVSELLTSRPLIEIWSFFNLRLAHNTGAAFSLLSEAGGWQRWLFTLLAVGVSLVLSAWLTGLAAQARWTAVGYACIIGGALGNAWDRVCYGHVVDFLDFHWAGWHYPTFNLADTAITLGAMLLLKDVLSAQHQAKVQGHE